MRQSILKMAISGIAGLALAAGVVTTASAQKQGGELKFVVGSKIPSFDAHRETTFGMIHPIRPFYSLLIRVNPDDPASPTDFVCDLCEGAIPEPTEDGTLYTFKIREGVEFHNGQPLTSADVKATLDKIIFPPEGTPSSRKAMFSMVEAIEAPDPTTLTIKLSFPSGAFIPALAMPFNFIYSKADLDEHGMDWHATNINGTGAFKFEEHQPGSFVSGSRFDKYHHEGKPYLDSFKAISAPKLAVRVQAIRGNRAAIEFRGFPPKQRDDLVKALGDKVTVQESDWNCVLLATPNQKVKPFDDPRVRQALTLAIDRWGGSKYLSNIAIVKKVGGVAFPGHPLATPDEELKGLVGYGDNMEDNVAQAQALLKEAGHENLKFTLNNRGVDQPYKVVGNWLIDQWKKAGMDVDQNVQPSPPFYDTLRKKKDFDVSIDFNCQSVVNPIADITKFLGSAGNNYGQYEDPVLEDLHAKMMRTGDVEEQKSLLREFEKRVLSDQAHEAVTLWWYRINPYRSYVQGWKTSPSHYLNQHLDNIWIE